MNGKTMKSVLAVLIATALFASSLAGCVSVYNDEPGSAAAPAWVSQGYGAGNENGTDEWNYSGETYPEPRFDEDAQIERYADNVSSDVKYANVEIQSLNGPVFIRTWDKSEYMVEVAIVSGNSGGIVPFDISNAVDVKFNASIRDDTLNLWVIIKANEDALADAQGALSGECYSQVKVHLPRLFLNRLIERDYEKSQSTLSGMYLNPFDSGRILDWDTSYNYNLHGSELHVDTCRVGFEAKDLRFGQADVGSYGAPKITNSVFGKLKITPPQRYGGSGSDPYYPYDEPSREALLENVECDYAFVSGNCEKTSLASCTIRNLQMENFGGLADISRSIFQNVVIRGGGGVRGDFVAENVTVLTGDRDVVLDLACSSSGTCVVKTENGTVELKLARGGAYGYDADLTTKGGRIDAMLDNATLKKSGNSSASLKTNDYNSKKYKLVIDVDTGGGDILVSHKGVYMPRRDREEKEKETQQNDSAPCLIIQPDMVGRIVAGLRSISPTEDDGRQSEEMTLHSFAHFNPAGDGK